METNIVGNKITQARKKLNLSQSDLARQIFISAQAVGKWERGESLPDIITLMRLAKILNVDLNYFSEEFQSSYKELKVIPSLAEIGTKVIPNQPKTDAKDLSKMNLLDGDFSGLRNLHERLNSTNIQRCSFVCSDIIGISINSNNIENSDFTNANLSKSIFRNSNLTKNNFSNCVLTESEFIGNNISQCDFSEADFTKTKVNSTNFESNKLTNAKFKGTQFSKVRFQNCVFEGLLENCHFENCSFYGTIRFENVSLINTFFKNNLKVKRLQFMNCKADKLTFAFLKTNGASMNGIELVE